MFTYRNMYWHVVTESKENVSIISLYCHTFVIILNKKLCEALNNTFLRSYLNI